MRTLSLLLLVSCNGLTSYNSDDKDTADPHSEGPDGSGTDRDEDGYDDDVDCNDLDPDIHPGAEETCDGDDQDCDDAVDEGVLTDWYIDSDGDGYGDEATLDQACLKPHADAIETGGDCDDEDEDVNPDADELCDDVDNDCDDAVDEDATDATVWYADSDGDGYGESDDYELSCDEPSGYGPYGGDCDDEDADVHPDAPENCDGVDDDCDEQIDEAGNVAEGDGETWYADDDGDGYGDAEVTIDACDEPSGYVDNDLDCNDSDAGEPVVADATNGSGAGDGSKDDPYDKIDDAVFDARECVLVYPGTYTESVTFLGRDISIVSTDGPDDTIVDASGTGGPAFAVLYGESSDMVIDGFTLTGDGYEEETTTSWACSSVETCTETITTYCGGGLYVESSDPTVQNLILADSSLPEVSESESGNDSYATYSYGGGACFVNSASVATQLDFWENHADQGGGLYVDENSAMELTATWFIANTASEGGGLELDGGQLYLANTVSTWNEASDYGGGGAIYDGGDLEAVNITMAGDSGSGLYINDSGTVELMNSIIYRSTGFGVKVGATGTFSGTYNNVDKNTSGDYGGTTDLTGSDGNISSSPAFVDYTDDGDPYNEDFGLKSSSYSVDAGNPDSSYDDADGTTNDQGAYGGPNSEWDD